MVSTVFPDESLGNIHVYMVSFPAQGHVNPLLRLAKRLANSGLYVTLSTAESWGQNILKVNKITGDEPTQLGRGSIRFELFDDGWSFDDPNRSSIELYVDQLESSGREHLTRTIKEHEQRGRPVSCLINNPFIPWVSDVAESLGIPSAMLWVQSCASFAAYYHFHNNLVPFPSEDDPEIDVQLPFMPLLKYDEVPSFLHPSSPYASLRVTILNQFKSITKPFCILMDTFDELEREIIDHMSKICRPIKTIGPLFKDLETNPTSPNAKISADLLAPDDCVEFLDSKPVGSVVYISFGTVVFLKQEQIDEIAYGLLNSEVSFLWVLKPPAAGTGKQPHFLPEGFMEKAGHKGKILQWAPQEKVLGHQSTACFVTHCGWNSSMEALASGVPVVAFPQWGDQVTDAKYLVDVFKVGIRMCRGDVDGRIVNREEVERCLREATRGGHQATEMRENAVKWKRAAEAAVAEGGTSYRNMQEFVDEIVRMKESRGLAAKSLE